MRAVRQGLLLSLLWIGLGAIDPALGGILAGELGLALAYDQERASARGCITFVGDVLLSRGVVAEIIATGQSPWHLLPRTPVTAWVGNLEGAVQDAPQSEPCTKPPRLCLGIQTRHLPWLSSAPFLALSVANNHSHDYGKGGYAATIAALTALDITPLSEESAPIFREIDGWLWAFVPINLVGRSAASKEAPLERARLQVGLARAKTPRVVVLPHWGIEYEVKPDIEQERLVKILQMWGATLIVGSHTHVVQDVRCEDGSAVYFGLGNHLFDQWLEATHTGLMVTCCPTAGGLDCTTAITRRTARSTFPMPAGHGPASGYCTVDVQSIDTAWLKHPAHSRFVFIQPFASLGAEHYFALHRRYSEFDQEEALRPYVFKLKQGQVIDLWRGTSLAWPLVAARLIQVDAREYLCAIHRGDSFLRRNPTTTERRFVVYKWTGFGFRGVDDPQAEALCRGL